MNNTYISSATGHVWLSFGGGGGGGGISGNALLLFGADVWILLSVLAAVNGVIRAASCDTCCTKSYSINVVLLMGWNRRATYHYLNKCWPSYVTSYGIIGPQWVIVFRGDLTLLLTFNQSWPMRNFVIPVNLHHLMAFSLGYEDNMNSRFISAFVCDRVVVYPIACTMRPYYVANELHIMLRFNFPSRDLCSKHRAFSTNRIYLYSWRTVGKGAGLWSQGPISIT